MRSIEQACYWMAADDSEIAPSLESDIQTDIAIIGGGFTGLWTSLFLKELDGACDVVILESQTVGYGGSGRNGGIVGETIDHSHSLSMIHFGFEEAKRLVSIGRKNLEEMAAFLSTN